MLTFHCSVIVMPDSHTKNKAILHYSFADDTIFQATGNTGKEFTNTLNDVTKGSSGHLQKNRGYRLTF